MAHRLARTTASIAAAAALTLAPPAAGLEQDPSPAADPHAGHDMGEAGKAGGGTASGHDAATDGHADHGDHADPPDSGTPAEDGGHDHGSTPRDESGHDGHGQLPATVTPEVRNLVLSGFAGVNVAVVLGAWLMRRTGPDPDPRKRAARAAS